MNAQASNRVLLLVEDNPADRSLVRELLAAQSSAGLSVLEVGSVAEAQEVLSRQTVHLILLDLNLPDGVGLEALERMRSVAPAVPVVVLTGFDDEEMVSAALRGGAVDFLVKGEDNSRAFNRAVGMALDRAALEQELEEQHQRLRDHDEHLGVLLRTAQDGIVSIDDGGEILFWNRGAETVFGYPVAEALGKSLSLILPEVLPQDALASLLGAAQADLADGVHIQDFVGRRKDGSTVPVEAAISGWTEGGRHRATLILRDVAERNAAKAAIESFSRQHELLLSCAGQGIIGLDPDGVVSFANPAALELLGLDVSELVGEVAHEVIRHANPEGGPVSPGDSLLSQCLADGVDVRAEAVFAKPDGMSFPVHVSYRPIVLEDQVSGAVMVFDDVSERKELEGQLRHSQKMEVVGSLAGGIAHDFNNELSVILLNVSLAQEDLAVGRAIAPESLDEIGQAAARATKITSQLLNFSRRASLEPEVTDLRDIVTHLGSVLSKLIPESIELTVQCDDEPCVASVDRGTVEQAILNLATNARDAMPTGGELVLTVGVPPEDVHLPERDGRGYHCICVRDTGIGMDEATQKQALIPFYTTKPRGKGTGLGLSMVYGLTQQLGGVLDIQSEVGVGTAVRLCFPATAAAAAVRSEPEGASASTGDGSTVLLVEDEAPLRDVCERVLRRGGYRVVSSDNGVEALRLYEESPDRFDIILSDLVMPGMGGMELWEEMTRRWGDVAFVLTTGHSDGGGSHVDGPPTLIKPWTMESLLTALHHELLRVNSTIQQG